jgi:integrase
MAATGIIVRHQKECGFRQGRRCNCDPHPGYRAWVYSKRDKKKIVSKTFASEAEARGWRTDAAKAVKDKKLRAPDSRTLAQEIDEWLRLAASGAIHSKRKQPYKPSVVRNYEIALRKRVLPELGHRKLGSVDHNDLLALQERLQADAVSASTIRNTFVPIQAVYRRAWKQGRVPVNPAIDLELPTAGVRERVATPEQALELIETLPGLERAIWACAFYAGLRRGEIRALRVASVQLDTTIRIDGVVEGAGTISVTESWDDVAGSIAPKTRASLREVFVLDVLRPYLEPLVAGRDPEALVFGYADATPFDARAISRKADRAWKAENERRVEEEIPPLERFTLHECRHSFSTWLDHAGISPDRADRVMGHSTGSVAGRYRHLLPEQRVLDRKRLDDYLSGTVAGKVVPIGSGTVSAPVPGRRGC